MDETHEAGCRDGATAVKAKETAAELRRELAGFTRGELAAADQLGLRRVWSAQTGRWWV